MKLFHTNVGGEVGHLQNRKWAVFCQGNPTQWVTKILKFFLESAKSVISQTQTLEQILKYLEIKYWNHMTPGNNIINFLKIWYQSKSRIPKIHKKSL